MTKDFLSEYGPEAKVSGNRASCGGVKEAKPLPYHPPKGPTDRMHIRPGLGGSVYPKGTQGKH